MTPKTLEAKSKYNQFDLDKDGTVTDAEIDRAKEMVDLELSWDINMCMFMYVLQANRSPPTSN